MSIYSVTPEECHHVGLVFPQTLVVKQITHLSNQGITFINFKEGSQQTPRVTDHRTTALSEYLWTSSGATSKLDLVCLSTLKKWIRFSFNPACEELPGLRWPDISKSLLRLDRQPFWHSSSIYYPGAKLMAWFLLKPILWTLIGYSPSQSLQIFWSQISVTDF